MMRAQCQFLARQAETNSQRQAEKPISAARQIRFQSKMSFITDGMLRFFHRTPPKKPTNISLFLACSFAFSWHGDVFVSPKLHRDGHLCMHYYLLYTT